MIRAVRKRFGGALVVLVVLASTIAGCADLRPPLLFDVLRETRAYVERADGPLELTLFRPVNRAEPGAGSPATSPAFATGRPMLVLFHGGAFAYGKRSQTDGFAEHFAGQGFVAASVTYRLSPRHPFPAGIQDAFAAARFLRAGAAEIGGDADRLGAIGFSAGGALAMFLGYCGNPDDVFGDCGDRAVSPRAQAVVNLYGPADLSYRFAEAHPLVRPIILEYMGCAPEQDPHRWRSASPITFVESGAAPTLSIHGTRDTLVAYEQAVRLDAALRASGAAHRLCTVDGRHGFGYEFGTKDSYALLPAMTAFLIRNLGP